MPKCKKENNKNLWSAKCDKYQACSWSWYGIIVSYFMKSEMLYSSFYPTPWSIPNFPAVDINKLDSFNIVLILHHWFLLLGNKIKYLMNLLFQSTLPWRIPSPCKKDCSIFFTRQTIPTNFYNEYYIFISGSNFILFQRNINLVASALSFIAFKIIYIIYGQLDRCNSYYIPISQSHIISHSLLILKWNFPEIWMCSRLWGSYWVLWLKISYLGL